MLSRHEYDQGVSDRSAYVVFSNTLQRFIAKEPLDMKTTQRFLAMTLLAFAVWGCDGDRQLVVGPSTDQRPLDKTSPSSTPWVGTQGVGEADRPWLSAPRSRDPGDPFLVPNDFESIQAAIDAAQRGGVVEIAPGEYWENVDVSRDHVRIVATGSVTLNGGFRVSADGVHIEGFRIRGGFNEGPGILIVQSSGVHAVGNTIVDTFNGASLVQSRNCLLWGNHVHSRGSSYLIAISSHDNRVIGNTGVSEADHGLVLTGTSGNLVLNNVFDGCAHTGIRVSSADGNRILGNSVNGNEHGVWITGGSEGNRVDRNQTRDNAISGITIESAGDRDTRLLLNRATGNGDCDIVDSGTNTRMIQNELDSLCRR